MTELGTSDQIANQKQENFWQQHCKQKHMSNIGGGGGGEILLQEDIIADFIWTDSVTSRLIDLIEENEITVYGKSGQKSLSVSGA